MVGCSYSLFLKLSFLRTGIGSQYVVVFSLSWIYFIYHPLYSSILLISAVCLYLNIHGNAYFTTWRYWRF